MYLIHFSVKTLVVLHVEFIYIARDMFTAQSCDVLKSKSMGMEDLNINF